MLEDEIFFWKDFRGAIVHVNDAPAVGRIYLDFASGTGRAMERRML